MLFYITSHVFAAYIVTMGFYWSFLHRRYGSKEMKNEHERDGEVKSFDGIDPVILQQRINWSAKEAEIAIFRSEVILARITRIETEIASIREIMKMILKAEIDVHGKIPLQKDNIVLKTKSQAEEVSELTNVDQQVVSLFSTGTSMTARDIQNVINRSREHTSRLLGRLVEIGVLKRDRIGRKFVYSLIDKNKVGPS